MTFVTRAGADTAGGQVQLQPQVLVAVEGTVSHLSVEEHDAKVGHPAEKNRWAEKLGAAREI